MKKKLYAAKLRKAMLICLCVVCMLYSAGQTYPDTTYGNKGYRKVMVSYDSLGIKKTTAETYDSLNRRRQTVIHTSDLEGNLVYITIFYKPGYAGVIESYAEIKREPPKEKKNEPKEKIDSVDRGYNQFTIPTGKIIYREEKVYNERGDSVERGYREILQPDGKTWLYQDFDPDQQEFDTEKGRYISTSSIKTEEIYCYTKSEFSAGYSPLFGSFYPVGIHLKLSYNINPHFGVALDVSHHRLKDGDIVQSRSFIMIEGHRVLGEVEDCDREWIPDVHVMVGLTNDKIKYKSGTGNYGSGATGPALGAGVGGVINISKKVRGSFQADVLAAKWGMEWFVQFRPAIGISLSLFDKKEN